MAVGDWNEERKVIMEIMGFTIFSAIIWFWFNPDRAGAWLAKAKLGFKHEVFRAERNGNNKR